MPIPIPYPLVNGHRVSRSSTDFIFFGVRMVGWKTYNDSEELTPGTMTGSSAKLQGRTRGKAKHTCSVEFYEEDWAAICIPAMLALNPLAGYGENAGPILLSFFEPGTIGVTEKEIIGARAMKVGQAIPDSEDALTRKVDFSVIDILTNGVSIVNDRISV